jgi:hypothetical protein
MFCCSISAPKYARLGLSFLVVVFAQLAGLIPSCDLGHGLLMRRPSVAFIFPPTFNFAYP